MAPAPKHSLQEQEALILEAAASSIEQSSLLDFTMADISKRAGLSMGTIYKHMPSKEDVLIALTAASYEHMHTVFSAVLALPLSSPQRLLALQLTTPEKIHRYPFGQHLEMLASHEHLRFRASSHWLNRLLTLDHSIGELFEGFMQAAWDSNELRGDHHDRDAVLAQLNLNTWSLCVGFAQVARQVKARHPGGGAEHWPFPLAIDHPIVQSSIRLLNSYQWANPITDKDLPLICQHLDAIGYR